MELGPETRAEPLSHESRYRTRDRMSRLAKKKGAMFGALRRNSTVSIVCLRQRLEEIGIQERSWLILERYFLDGWTYQEIGDHPSVQLTRERVRQLISRSTRKAMFSETVLHDPLDILNKSSGRLWDPFAPEVGVGEAVTEAMIILARRQYNDTNAAGVRRFFAIVRLVVDQPSSSLMYRFPSATFAICGLAKPVTAHRLVQARIEQIAEEDRKWSYRELGIAVLEDAGQPLHWREIARLAEQLGHRENVNPTAMFNVLPGHPDTFVWLGQGTYGLVKWGSKRPRYYKEIIADVLRSLGKPATDERIYSLVSQERAIKWSSLVMFLGTHPDFYMSVEETYGLREWLPPRIQQTLRTPRWLIEDEGSIHRVERARENGYDVDRWLEEEEPDETE